MRHSNQLKLWVAKDEHISTSLSQTQLVPSRPNPLKTNTNTPFLDIHNPTKRSKTNAHHIKYAHTEQCMRLLLTYSSCLSRHNNSTNIHMEFLLTTLLKSATRMKQCMGFPNHFPMLNFRTSPNLKLPITWVFSHSQQHNDHSLNLNNKTFTPNRLGHRDCS
jgi:hypothetical protein